MAPVEVSTKQTPDAVQVKWLSAPETFVARVHAPSPVPAHGAKKIGARLLRDADGLARMHPTAVEHSRSRFVISLVIAFSVVATTVPDLAVFHVEPLFEDTKELPS